MKIQEQIGKKFSNMEILEVIGYRKVKCRCDCGNLKNCDFQDLRRGRIKACGCKRHTPELNELSRIRAYQLLEKGVLNKGGDNYPKEDREFKYMLYRIKTKGRKECFISVQDLKDVWESQNGICAYSKIKLSLPTFSNPNSLEPYYMASVDRIDSLKPYSKDNIQFVSRTINYAKNSMTHEQMCEFIELIKFS
jgi:hypothetical protein